MAVHFREPGPGEREASSEGVPREENGMLRTPKVF